MSSFPHYQGFSKEQLTAEDVAALEVIRKRCAGRIVLATTLANSGHPGGSLSTLPMLLTIYTGSRYNIQEPWMPGRDRVFISHGHTSPGTYSVLAELGYFPEREMLLQFRTAGSRYAGHVETDVPGVEWCTGNLGQGLSAGTASALAGKMQGLDHRTFVLMGDGEHQKGQISEARRFAVKFGLNNLMAIVDYNQLQISGKIEKVMPQDIIAEYKASGWNVLEVDGKDFAAIYQAMAKAFHHKTEKPDCPTMILAHTIMGYGIPFIENDHEYHGKPFSKDQAKEALKILGSSENIDTWLAEKAKASITHYPHFERPYPQVQLGTPRVYAATDALDNRSAYGNALTDLGQANNAVNPKVLAVTCDLAVSVKMTAFAKQMPKAFIESGIQEHHAATLAGRLSLEDFVVFFSTFGVFGVGETYNQLRLNTFNHTHLKLVCTHIGLNVGEDGPTHQSIDYIGLVSSLFNIRASIPADPNQTDRIIRKVASLPGNDFVGMGRDKAPIILDEQGQPFFGKDYEYVPGKADWLRRGQHGSILAIGPMVPVAIEAHQLLKKQGMEVAVLNMASVVPLDTQAVLEAAKLGPMITMEDHNVQTGLGSLVANVLAEHRLAVPFCKLGVTKFSSSGKPGSLYEAQGLTANNAVQQFMKLRG